MHIRASQRRRMIIALVISLSGFSITVNVMPSLVTRFSEVFSLNPAVFGAAFSLQFVSYAVTSSVIAYMTGRGFSSLEPLLMFSLLCSSLCLALIGFVPGFISLVMLMAVIGACGGCVEASGTSLLSQYDTSPGGRLVHLSQFFYCIGAFSAPLIIALLLHLDSSLQTVGWITGGLTLLVSLAVLLLIKRRPDEGHPSTLLPDENPREKLSTLQGFIWFLLMMFLYVVIEVSAVSWFPFYMEYRFTVPSSSASLSLTLFWTGLAVSRLLYALISVRRTVLHTALCSLGIAVSLVLLQTAVISYALQLVFVLMLGFFCGPVWPLLIELCKIRFRRKHLIMYLISAGSIGALIGPSLTSLLFSRFGVSSLLSILLGYTACMGIVLVFLRSAAVKR